MPHTANSSAHTATTTRDDSRSRSKAAALHTSRRRWSTITSCGGHSSTHAITSTTHTLTRTHLCIRAPADARRADTHSHLRRHDSHIGTRHQCSTCHQPPHPHTHAHTHRRPTHTSRNHAWQSVWHAAPLHRRHHPLHNDDAVAAAHGDGSRRHRHRSCLRRSCLWTVDD
jgi:hypothetical protein